MIRYFLQVGQEYHAHCKVFNQEIGSLCVYVDKYKESICCHMIPIVSPLPTPAWFHVDGGLFLTPLERLNFHQVHENEIFFNG